MGELEFDIGASQTCTTARDLIYVCFGTSAEKKCFVSPEPLGKFVAIKDSTYEHRETALSASEGKETFNDTCLPELALRF